MKILLTEYVHRYLRRYMHMCDWHDPSVAGIIIGKGIRLGMNFSWKINETCINSEKHAKGWKWRVGVLCSFPLIVRFFQWCGVKGVEWNCLLVIPAVKSSYNPKRWLPGSTAELPVPLVLCILPCQLNKTPTRLELLSIQMISIQKTRKHNAKQLAVQVLFDI